MITVSNLLDTDRADMSYDVTNIEKGIIGTKFPSPMHKMMVEELSRLVGADATKVRHISDCINRVPVKQIEMVNLNDLISSYGLKV
jgi:hypothetical protein